MLNFIKHKAKDWLRFFYYSLNNSRYRFNMKRFRECVDRKPRSLIKKEISELKRYWGCIPMQYYTHDFYRKDCLLSIEEMKTYIPSYYFYFIIYPRFDDLTGAKFILENKITCLFLFRGMGLPTTEIIAFKKSGKLYDLNGQLLNSAEFSSRLKSYKVDKIFVKPVSGSGGKGIRVIHKSEDGFFISDSTPFGYDKILELPGDYVIETQIVQSDYLNKIYPHSVNTLRAVTCRRDNGSAELIAVTLRMGTEGRQVDNGTQGGLLIGINLETGHPIRPYAGYEYGCEKIFTHPDTGFEFAGLEIPNWNETKEFISKFAHKMALYNLVGWDIALTDDGPVVIEANTKFGIDHSQSGVGGMRDSFVNGSPREALFQ